jgi:hypothetical protein
VKVWPAGDRASLPDAPPILINASLPEMVKAQIPRSSEGSLNFSESDATGPHQDHFKSETRRALHLVCSGGAGDELHYSDACYGVELDRTCGRCESQVLGNKNPTSLE